jgi:hypothetical protein
LQRAAKKPSNVQSQGKNIGAITQKALLIQLAADGIGYTTMSNEAYADLKNTAQFKKAMHGACSVGRQTIVTQYHNANDVAQMLSWPPTMDELTAGLIILEGVLTLAAGSIAISVTAAATPVSAPLLIASILATVVGVSKIARGSLMFCEKTEAKTKIMDGLRHFEAAMALLAGG